MLFLTRWSPGEREEIDILTSPLHLASPNLWHKPFLEGLIGTSQWASPSLKTISLMGGDKSLVYWRPQGAWVCLTLPCFSLDLLGRRMVKSTQPESRKGLNGYEATRAASLRKDGWSGNSPTILKWDDAQRKWK